MDVGDGAERAILEIRPEQEDQEIWESVHIHSTAGWPMACL